jgi:DNA replication protein DnaC
MEEQAKSGNESSKQSRETGLTPIGETLNRLNRESPRQPIGERNGRSGEAGPEPPLVEKTTGECTCKECGRTFTGEITIYHVPGMVMLPGEIYPLVPKPRPPREIRPYYCPECKAKKDQADEAERRRQLAEQRQLTVQEWRRGCGIPPELAMKKFGNFEKGRQIDAYNDAEAWAKGFDLENPRGYPSLIFYSDEPGLGKTHLMVSIANYLFDHWLGAPGRRRSPVLFVKGPQLVRRIRYTYNLSPEDYAHEREEDVYREITGVPLLMLDDVGKENPSKFTRETYWYIIDERVTSGLPVIITSRLPLGGDDSLAQLMGKDTVDRLYGMTRGEVTEMTGKSYRREKEIP